MHHNNNRTLLDAPVVGTATTLVPSPVVATTPAPTTTSPTALPATSSPAIPVTTAVNGAAVVTTVAAAGSVTRSATGVVTSVNGTPVMAANGSIRGSVQWGANGAPPSLMKGSPAVVATSQQGSAALKPTSVHGSLQQGSQQHQPMQAPGMSSMLPEPMLPTTQPVDTKQEIVENYLNSLPQNMPSASQGNQMHFMGNGR